MDLVTSEATNEVEVKPGVYLAQLATGEKMSIQHLRMDLGARVPEHSHYHEQLGFVYQGEQTFLLDNGEAATVGPGKTYWLESQEVHAAENRGDDELLAIDIFSPPCHSPNWLD